MAKRILDFVIYRHDLWISFHLRYKFRISFSVGSEKHLRRIVFLQYFNASTSAHKIKYYRNLVQNFYRI